MTNQHKQSARLQELKAEAAEEQKIISLNAWHLARYIIEHANSDDGDDKIEVPGNIDIGNFLFMAEKYPALDDSKKPEFLNQYAELEKVSKSVTARTLYATRIHGKGFFRTMFKTSVGRHLLVLSAVTAGFIYLMMTAQNPQSPQNQMFPFYAAGLGACVYILRVTQGKLKSRKFDPAWIPSHYIRIILGTLAGGTIVFFPEIISVMSGQSDQMTEVLGNIHSAALEATLSADQKAALDTAQKAALGAAQAIKLDNHFGAGTGLVAFIFGYAVDIYYGVLDRIGGSIKGETARK